MAAKPHATAISLLGALFDRLQLQAAAELSKRLNEFVPSSGRDKNKRPSSVRNADTGEHAILVGFPRQCGFYEQTLAALLGTVYSGSFFHQILTSPAELEADCGESLIKVLLMWQPRFFLEQHSNGSSSSSSKGNSRGSSTSSSPSGSWISGSSIRARNKGFNFAAFIALVEPLRQLDFAYTELVVRAP